MQRAKPLHPPTNKKDLKTTLLTNFSFAIPHTICWWLFDFYSTKLYAFMMATFVVLAIVYILDAIGPKNAELIKCVALGSFPAVLAWALPKYSFFAICCNFICFAGVALSVSLLEISVLSVSNILGWIGCFCYYEHWYLDVEYHGEDDGDPKYIKIFFGDSLHLYQLLLLLATCSFVARLLVRERQDQLKARLSYEEKLLSLNNELEGTNQKLFQTNKELQDALQEKENFILRFSHEIRNPLNSLLGNVDLCQEFAENEESRQMLREAKVSGEILLQLLNNILDTAKVSAGGLDISLQYQDIRGFLERAWIVCSEIIRKKKLYGCLSLDMNVPENIEFDTHRLMQILINLISNAAKFTEHGYVKIFVEYEEGAEIKSEDMKPRHADSFEKPEESGLTLAEELNQEEFSENPLRNYETLSPTKKRFGKSGKGSFMKIRSGQFSDLSTDPKDGYLRLEIIDTGCGIKKKDLDAIFAKFSQVSEESSKRQIGTGLGLWITKEIVELMSGKIEVFSVPNHGTVLVIMLKCKSGHPSLSLEHSPIVIDPEPIHIKRAMVVEDILYNQEINYKFLQKCNVGEIAVTNNGKEALDLYIQKGEGYFDLILMDIDMPVMDGKVATKRIRQYEMENGWKPTTIIFLTAYSESKMQKELLDPQGVYKADGFLSKPTSQDIIRRTLDEHRLKSLRKKQRLWSIQSNPELRISNDSKNDQLVLLIDDDPYNLSIVSKMLVNCGFKPLEALNGRDALELYESHWQNISLVLTDCEMPVMGGIQVAQEILARHKKFLRKQKLVIYGVTGRVEADYKKQCFEAGMKDVLVKPITFERLKALLLHIQFDS